MSTFKNSDGAVRFGRNDYARLSSMSLPPSKVFVVRVWSRRRSFLGWYGWRV